NLPWYREGLGFSGTCRRCLGYLSTVYMSRASLRYRPASGEVAAGGKVRPILKDEHLTILDAQWTPDSKYLIAEIIEGTRGSLIAINVQDGSFRRVTELVVSQASFSLSTNGAITAYLNQSPRSPNDVWILLSDVST